MILILSNEEDITTDFVVRELEQREFVRINLEQVPAMGSFTFEYGSLRTNAHIRFLHHHFDLDDVAAVYYRRPGIPEPDASIEDDGVRRYARDEFCALVDGPSRLIRRRWVNHPQAVRRAESKILQLSEARRCGLSIPRTIISNNPERARRFSESLNGRVVVKAQSAHGHVWLDSQIQARIQGFVIDLSALVRASAVEAVAQALGNGARADAPLRRHAQRRLAARVRSAIPRSSRRSPRRSATSSRRTPGSASKKSAKFSEYRRRNA